MAVVCVGPEFTNASGELALARVGVFREATAVSQTALNDGVFGSIPSGSPRTHIDLEATWVNNTGMPQFAYARALRGPWSITVANPNYAIMRDRLTYASGVDARAAEPSTVSVFDSEFMGNIHADDCFFCLPQAQERKATSYATQDRGFIQAGYVLVQPGETFSARYRVTLVTNSPFVSVLGPANYEARARYGTLKVFAAPARGI